MDRNKLTEDQYRNDQKIAAVEASVHTFRSTWAEQISKMTMGEAQTADVEATLSGVLEGLTAQITALATDLKTYFDGIRPEVEAEFPPVVEEGGDGDGDGDTTQGGLAGRADQGRPGPGGGVQLPAA